jgi:hypothetical protein
VSNTAKQKGTAMETLVREYLNDAGFVHAHRTPLQGGGDTGDINGIANTVGRKVAIQVKNQRKFDLSGWLNATVEQASRLGNALPALIVKRPGKGKSNLGDTYVVMRLTDLVDLLKEAHYS